MPMSSDLDNEAIMEIVQYYKQKDKERTKEVRRTISTGKRFIIYNEKENRGETEVGEIIDKFFVAMGIYTPGDPEQSNNLKQVIYDHINRKLFRVEHSEYQRKLRTAIEREWVGAVFDHAQIKDAISSGRDLEVSKKMKVHTKFGLIHRLRSALGYKSDEKEWTEE